MPHSDVSFTRYFADLPDPRIDRTRKHKLIDILAIALCAVIAGADSWDEIERFGLARESWLKRFLELPHGIPSHDTFYRVFARIDPRKFGACVAEWMTAVCEATGLRHIVSFRQACKNSVAAASRSGSGRSPVAPRARGATVGQNGLLGPTTTRRSTILP